MNRRLTLLVAGVLAVGISAAAVALIVGVPGSPGTTGDSLQGPRLAFQPAPDNAGINYTSHDTGIGDGNASVYATDFNRDGWTDVLTVGSPDGPTLYRNDGGHFEPSGALPENLDIAVHSALWFDYDDDGWQDLLLLGDHQQPVLLNNDGGTLVESGDAPNVTTPYPMGATAADYDGDGCADLFVFQSGDWGERVPVGYNKATDVDDDNGNQNLLFRGSCGDGFTNVTSAAGVTGQRWSLAASFVDLTGDGLPDVHVANDYNNDTLLVNQGDGTFASRELGSQTDRNGMSSEVFDVNYDGNADVLVTNIWLPVENSTLPEQRLELLENFMENRLGKRAAGNTLLVSHDNGTLTYGAQKYGLVESGWGWAAAADDFNNDRTPDVVHATERFFTVYPDDPVYTLPQVWQRSGDDYAKLDPDSVGFSNTDGRGLASVDYDRDGDLDLVMAQYDGTVEVYENTAAVTGNWLKVDLENPGGSTLAARVNVTAGSTSRYGWANAKAGFLSQDLRPLHFGLGYADSATVVVTWPDGSTTTVTDVAANATVTIDPDGVRDRSSA